jgi:hypothetical protein
LKVDRDRFPLTDEEVLELGRHAMAIEKQSSWAPKWTSSSATANRRKLGLCPSQARPET